MTENLLSDRLDREWAQLGRRPAVLARIRSWGATGPDEPTLTSLDDLLRRAGHRQPPSAAANEVLGRLLDRAAHDPLAGRVVLQRILPGLLAIVRVEQRRRPEVDAFDQLIGEAWASIVRYRAAERPDDVAARLLHDTRHRAFTNPRRKRRVAESLCAPDQVAEPRWPSDRSAFEELTAILREARERGLRERDLAIVRGLLEHGSSAQLAESLALDARAVRYRRDIAVHHIRRILRHDILRHDAVTAA